ALNKFALAQAEINFWEGHYKKGSKEAVPHLEAAKERLKTLRDEEFLRLAPEEQAKRIQFQVDKADDALQNDLFQMTTISDQIDKLCDEHFQLGGKILCKIEVLKSLKKQLTTTQSLLPAHPDVHIHEIDSNELPNLIKAFIHNRDNPTPPEPIPPPMGSAAPFADKVLLRINDACAKVDLAMSELQGGSLAAAATGAGVAAGDGDPSEPQAAGTEKPGDPAETPDLDSQEPGGKAVG
ncbi:unnamed protein product, partial [Prorocentrum cordatum]